MIKRRLFPILLMTILMVACGKSSSSERTAIEEINASEYISTTGTATTEKESKIELEDGAAIVVPVDSIDQDTTILVERNPEKVAELPAFGDDVFQLGDFYNFEVTSGELIGPVDLILPFDSTRIPKGDGMLAYAYPSDNGWEYIPAKADGNKVTIYTAKVGDPVMVWHFFPGDQERIDAEIAKHKYCDPTIAVSVIPESGRSDQDFSIVGAIMPLSNDITTKMTDALKSFIFGQETSSFGNMPIEIMINNDPNRTISATTNQDGTFSVNFNPDTDSALGFNEGINRLTVRVECNNFFDPELTSISEGYGYFNILPSVDTNTSETVDATSEIIPTASPIPPGAILLPDFTGQTMTDAKEWLEANDFKYSWIDGKSTQEVGHIYNQAPIPGEYKVPNRTTILLFRTNEKLKLVDDFYAIYNCINYYSNSFDASASMVYRPDTNEIIEGITDNHYTTTTCPSEWTDFNLTLISIDPLGVPVFLRSNSHYSITDSSLFWTDGNPKLIPSYIDDTSGIDYVNKTEYSEYLFTPAGTEVIPINGRNISVQVYTGINRENFVYSVLNNGNTLTESYEKQWKYKYYYDLASGILVRFEEEAVVIDCQACDQTVIGMKYSLIMEISETNQTFGDN